MNDKQAYEALWADDAARALTTANEKYKHVARIVECGIGSAVYMVYQVHDYGEDLHDALDTLEEAIESCKWLDNAEPRDRQF